MKFSLFLTGLLFLFSCGQKPEAGTIPFLNGVTYKVSESARIVKPSTASLDRYEELLSLSGLNIPLYRVAHEGTQTTYFGIPFETDLETLSKTLAETEIVSGGTGEQSYRYIEAYLDPMNTTHAFIFEQNETMALVLNAVIAEELNELPTAETVLTNFQYSTHD